MGGRTRLQLRPQDSSAVSTRFLSAENIFRMLGGTPKLEGNPEIRGTPKLGGTLKLQRVPKKGPLKLGDPKLQRTRETG